jgi:hypothetical protein
MDPSTAKAEESKGAVRDLSQKFKEIRMKLMQDPQSVLRAKYKPKSEIFGFSSDKKVKDEEVLE